MEGPLPPDDSRSLFNPYNVCRCERVFSLAQNLITDGQGGYYRAMYTVEVFGSGIRRHEPAILILISGRGGGSILLQVIQFKSIQFPNILVSIVQFNSKLQIELN